MDLFQRLTREHATILEMVIAFENYLEQAKSTEVDANDLPRFLVFFREYADLVHHQREEDILLPAMARHGFSLEFGPSAYIRAQHERERDLLQELMRYGLRKGGCPPKDEEMQRLANAFLTFQRLHMAKENELLYPEAAKQLVRESELLRKELDRFDALHDAHGRGAWLERLVGELASVYGPHPA